ncbi:class I SAM-dependent methyltransferase [Granulosicoccus sp.]|nr:class I SAM-dependent methyltransferase [Granulosicoccus sp.]
MSAVKIFLKPVVQPILKPLAKVRAKQGLTELRAQGAPACIQIADAIEQAMDGALTAEERDWVTRIEDKRRQLNDSREPIHQIDFGAGKDGNSRTSKEMAHGVMVESSIGRVSSSLSKPYFWSVLLFKLVRQFQPEVALELGTAVGISAAYQSAAQKLNGHGRTISLEGNQSFADLAAGNLDELGLDNVKIICGRFADTLSTVSKQEKPLSYMFIDGHHDEVATVEYFETIIPSLAAKSLVIFDDISWSDGMRRAWQRVTEHDQCSVSVDLVTLGLCVVDSAIDGRNTFQFPLRYM